MFQLLIALVVIQLIVLIVGRHWYASRIKTIVASQEEQIDRIFDIAFKDGYDCGEEDGRKRAAKELLKKNSLL